MITVSETLMQITVTEGRGGRLSAGAAELAVHIAYVRQRERMDLVGLKAFLGEAVPARHGAPLRPGGAGEADRLCNACIVGYSTGDVILCTLEAGHREGDTPLREEPEGWHRVQRAHPD